MNRKNTLLTLVAASALALFALSAEAHAQHGFGVAPGTPFGVSGAPFHLHAVHGGAAPFGGRFGGGFGGGFGGRFLPGIGGFGGVGAFRSPSTLHSLGRVIEPPYFATNPPVQYSYPVGHEYGENYYIKAYDISGPREVINNYIGGASGAAANLPPAQPQMIENPYVNGDADAPIDGGT